MNHEVAINLNGMVVEVQTGIDTITFNKGDQFAAEMANKQKVIVDDKVITTAENRRQWMHRKLDNWIDGVEDEWC